MAEYWRMSLNMSKNAWKNCSEYARVINMPWYSCNNIIIVIIIIIIIITIVIITIIIIIIIIIIVVGYIRNHWLYQYGRLYHTLYKIYIQILLSI